MSAEILAVAKLVAVISCYLQGSLSPSTVIKKSLSMTVIPVCVFPDITHRHSLTLRTEARSMFPVCPIVR